MCALAIVVEALQAVAAAQIAERRDVVGALLRIAAQSSGQLQGMQRSTEGAGAGATVAEVLIGRVAIQVVQIGAHGAHQIRKSAQLEVLSPGLAGRQPDGGIAPATLAEEGLGAEGEAPIGRESRRERGCK